MYIYIYSFSRHFYPKRFTIGEYNKRDIIKRQTVTGSACNTKFQASFRAKNRRGQGKRAKVFLFYEEEAEVMWRRKRWVFRCRLKIVRDSAFRMGSEVHSTSQERWIKMFWKVILCLSVMAPRGVTHSQISGFWKECRLSSVSGSRRVLSLWLFYMQASVSWTWCELQPGASAGRQREVLHGPFWVCWRPIMLQHTESSVKVWLCMMEVQLE